ncbi:helix-turn-helix domain-containing protein [Acholeplasma hippikon]|uniref:Predicted transcriptional regulator n=1 Tax=Acholeplasma hippikon TaxID=264636 RepID=A0A449BL04_9MOLU|nr:helix-turn-helix transcriptional regulator [Acholeplasma hippikon]VEU83155.1 Predicted transcriptional regulator [Acholeplasma hippikon]
MDNNERGNHLRKLRNEHNLTQEALASRLGFESRTAIVNMENGKEISSDVILGLCEIYKVDPNTILMYQSNNQNSLTKEQSKKEVIVYNPRTHISYFSLIFIILLTIPLFIYYIDKELTLKYLAGLIVLIPIGLFTFFTDAYKEKKKSSLTLQIPIINKVKYKHELNEKEYIKQINFFKKTRVMFLFMSVFLNFISIGIIGLTDVMSDVMLGVISLSSIISIIITTLSLGDFNKEVTVSYKAFKTPVKKSLLSILIEVGLYFLTMFSLTVSELNIDFSLFLFVVFLYLTMIMRYVDLLSYAKFSKMYKTIEVDHNDMTKQVIKFDVQQKQIVSIKNKSKK